MMIYSKISKKQNRIFLTLNLILILILPNILFCQISPNQKKNFAISFQVGYLIPQNISGGEDHGVKSGFAFKPSFSCNLSEKVTGLIEYSYSKHEHYSSYKSYYEIMRSLNLGLRIYPISSNNFYLKPAISYSLNGNSKFPLFNKIVGGIGNDFNINKSIDLFGEAEIIAKVLIDFGISYSFGAGLKFKLF